MGDVSRYLAATDALLAALQVNMEMPIEVLARQEHCVRVLMTTAQSLPVPTGAEAHHQTMVNLFEMHRRLFRTTDLLLHQAHVEVIQEVQAELEKLRRDLDKSS